MANISSSNSLGERVPKLRFPEFEGEWEKCKVAQIFRRIQMPVDVEEAKSYIQIGIRSHGKGLFYKEPVLGEELGNKRVFWIEPNCFIVNIVFAWERAVAKTTISENGLIASHRFPMYKPISEIVNLDYVTIYFITKYGQKILELASPGGAGRNKTLGQNEFLNSFIVIPKIKEQKKIAEFIQLINKKIKIQQSLVESLKLYKRGLLSKLFPQKGERVPQYRFEGFTDAWEQRNFIECFDYLQNNSLSRAELSNENGEILNVHYGDILVKFGEVIDLELEELPSLLDNSILEKYINSVLQDGDIVIADAAEDETVGKCSEIMGCNGRKILAGLHTIPVRPREKYAIGYLGYYMNSKAYHNQLLPLMQGTKVSSISKTSIQDTIIIYPIHKEEQKKIGDYFAKLDNLITLHQKKYNFYEKEKLTLLQQMFI